MKLYDENKEYCDNISSSFINDLSNELRESLKLNKLSDIYEDICSVEVLLKTVMHAIENVSSNLSEIINYENLH